MARAAAARRYAKALFSLAREDSRIAEVREETQRGSARLLAESAELRAVLLQPLHPVAERRAVLGAVAERARREPAAAATSCPSWWTSAASWTGTRSRPSTAASPMPRPGLTKARVTSAAPLSDAQRDAAPARARAEERRAASQLAVEIDPDARRRRGRAGRRPGLRRQPAHAAPSAAGQPRARLTACALTKRKPWNSVPARSPTS